MSKAQSQHHNIMPVTMADLPAPITADFRELLIGHSTWDSYSQIVRLFKHFSFNLMQPGVAAQRLSYSSYPGEVFSDDDL